MKETLTEQISKMLLEKEEEETEENWMRHLTEEEEKAKSSQEGLKSYINNLKRCATYLLYRTKTAEHNI